MFALFLGLPYTQQKIMVKCEGSDIRWIRIWIQILLFSVFVFGNVCSWASFNLSGPQYPKMMMENNYRIY